MSVLNTKLEGLGERCGGDLPPLTSVRVPIVRTFPVKRVFIGAVFCVAMGSLGWVSLSERAILPSDESGSTAAVLVPVRTAVPESVNQLLADLSAQAGSHLKVTANAWQSAVSSAKPLSKPQSLSASDAPVKLISSEREVSATQPLSRSTSIPQPALLSEPSQQAISPSADIKNHLVIETQTLSPVDLMKKAVKDAHHFLAKGDVINAISGFESALGYEPNNLAVRQQLAAIHYGRGDVWQAEKILLAGLRPEQFQGELRWTLAKLWGQEKNPTKALSFLLPDDDTASANYLLLRAQLAQGLGQYPLALSTYEQLTGRFPTLDSAWLGFAIESERVGGLSNAKWAYQRAMTGQSLSSQSMAFIQQRLRLLGDV